MTQILTDADQPQAPDSSFGPNPLPQLRAYWEGLRVAGGIPARADVNPRGIESALSCTFLLERIAPGIARFRIAGMDLADVMGMEVRGLPFSSLFCGPARARLAEALEQVFISPAVLTMDLTAERGMGRPVLLGQVLAMPLRDDQGRIQMALGCIALKGKVGRNPRRFEIAHTSLARLERPAPSVIRDACAAPQAVPTATEKDKRRYFAEAAGQFDTAKPCGASYLRLVK